MNSQFQKWKILQKQPKADLISFLTFLAMICIISNLFVINKRDNPSLRPYSSNKSEINLVLKPNISSKKKNYILPLSKN